MEQFVILKRLEFVGRLITIVLSSLLLCEFRFAQGSPSAGTTTFVLDGNRMYAELGFVRPDGSVHRALAFVDMGSPSMTLTETLFKELQVDEKKLLHFQVGGLTVEVPRAEISSERRESRSMGTELKVEAMLPAGILRRYQVVMDYQRRTLTLALPGTLRPEGDRVPIQISSKTGLIAIDVVIDGKHYPLTIDNGSAYTWVRQSAAKSWLASHPDWERGVGAVGASNMMMSGDATETSGTLMRIPEISIGSLILKDVGVLAAGPGKSPIENLDLFDWYAQKNAVLVIGWIGGNVLKSFRLMIDYPNGMTYWTQQSDLDAHDLDQVGLTLRFEDGAYFVAAVATKNGKPTVEGILPGDRLFRVDELEVEKASWGAIYNALHGKPGETRELVVERKGNRITVPAKVTAF